MQQLRPPIVVILGHVDHGKTSLLDKIRSSAQAAKEAGGITQHISAHQHEFNLGGSKFTVTFIDTPGHAAFDKMRSRGGMIADIAILVISSVDGIMPQTKEALDIIRGLKLPTIVAATKIDLSETSLDKLKSQLSENNLIPEDYGGDVPVIPVSAKTGQGVENLIDTIRLLDELHPVKADPEAKPEGIIIESRMDNNKGPLATILMKNGTLKTHDIIYAESVKCKIRSIISDSGRQVLNALPSQPVEILGFTSPPPVGSLISLHPASSHIPSVSIHTRQEKTQDGPTLSIILKVDVTGSLEALQKVLAGQDLFILHSGTGDINESDVLTATRKKSIIYGFNVKAASSTLKLAQTEAVTVNIFSVIYELIDDVERRIELFKNPHLEEKISGIAKILAIFSINNSQIAGSKIESGQIRLGDKIHLIRGEQIVADSRIKSLKKGKDAVETVKTGEEFGAILSPAVDFKAGDMIVSFTA